MRIETSGPLAFQDLQLFPSDGERQYDNVVYEDRPYRLWEVAGNKFMTNQENQVLGVKKADGHIILWGFMVSCDEPLKEYVHSL